MDSYTDIMTRAKQQAATATQLSAKTLLESLIKARKALDTAAVVPLTTGWYYILAADSASLSTERRTALLSAEGAKEPAWQEAADRDWHYVWHITRLDTAASLCDVRGPLFAVKNYATGLYAAVFPTPRQGRALRAHQPQRRRDARPVSLAH